jgi:hypothetical protein
MASRGRAEELAASVEAKDEVALLLRGVADDASECKPGAQNDEKPTQHREKPTNSHFREWRTQSREREPYRSRRSTLLSQDVRQPGTEAA